MTWEEKKVQFENEKEGHLKDGVDCPICKNKGFIMLLKDNGYITSKDCECMQKRKINRRIEESGLADLFSRYTFETFKTDETHHKYIKDSALKYLKTFKHVNALGNEHNDWFVISGQVGSGKSHICTSISKWFIEHGYDFKYLAYAQDVPRITKRMDSGYIDVKEKAEEEFDRLKNVQVLYIDDYLKSIVSNKIFELINHRYSNNKLITIISTEYYEQEQRKIDEAVSSRIYERANGHWVNIAKAQNKNYRFKDKG